MNKRREEMTCLANRLRAMGIPVRGWWWMEQGGPFWSTTRLPAGVQGEQAAPLILATDIQALLPETWFKCPECGSLVRADEDGCCATCGQDCETVEGVGP